MTTAEMQNLQNLSSPPSMKDHAHASSLRAPASASNTASSPAPAPTPAWMIVLMVCIAAATLAASLAYMGTAERPPAAGYALDRDWSAASPLGVDPAAPTQSPMKIPTPVCDVCGRVEAVVSVLRPPEERVAAAGEGGRKSRANGRKPIFEVQVRMDDGQTRTVHVEKPLAVGTLVTLEHGVLRPANA
jgi:hypothetical protein